MQLTDITQQSDGLWTARTQPLPQRGDAGDADLESMRDLLKQVMIVNGMPADEADRFRGEQVMNNLIMLLPIPVSQKQPLISQDDLHDRWQGLKQAITDLIEEQEESDAD